MWERLAVFLFLVVVALGSLGGAGWLVATGQAVSVEGLFLVLVALLLALVCGVSIYVMIRGAMEAIQAPSAAAKPAAATQSKPAQGKPAQTTEQTSAP